MLQRDEHIEYLNKDIGLIVSPDHGFGTDALLLAHFASPRRRDKVMDLGTGCGIIAFYWLREGLADVHALEIQDRAFDQLSRSIALSKSENKIRAYHADLRNIKGLLPLGSFDLVTMNPPYTQKGSGIISSGRAEQIARHDTCCTLDDACLAASSLLRYGGRFCICLRPERLADAVMSMKNHDLEPKRMRFVAGQSGKAPWLLLLEGRRGGKSGMVVEAELHIRGEVDGYSAEMRAIIGSYYDNRQKEG